MIHKCLSRWRGCGTRFLPATKSSPKEMLPVVNKPLIGSYAVQEAVDAGLTRIGFVTGRGKHELKDHFDKNCRLRGSNSGHGEKDLIQPTRDLIDACEFSYPSKRDERPWSCDSDGQAVGVAMNRSLSILLDDLCIADGDEVLMQMVKLFRQFRCSIVAVEEVPDDHIHHYGVVAGELLKDGVYRITDMIEKPSLEEAPSTSVSSDVTY